MSVFTCISCRVAFGDADIQRAHYKTDWHRYNLKRKVAEMPPVTAENFQERVLAQRAQVDDSTKDTSGHCKICNKHFNTQNAFENHIRSKKHKEIAGKQEEQEISNKNKKNKNESKVEKAESKKLSDKDAKNLALKESMEVSVSSEPLPGASGTSSSQGAAGADEEMASDTESCEEWDGDSLGIEECFFCSYISKSLDDNLKHMADTHSFFLPDIDYLVDVEGLITYLGEKIGQGKICLWCNERTKTFLDTKSVQKHMLDKGHCKMTNEGDAMYEYSDYYDYRPSYPDYKEGEEEPMDEDRVGAFSEDLEGDDYSLVLPSGATVGHRSLMRYYRQNLKPDRQLVVRDGGAVNRAMAHYRALGWTGCTGTVAQRKAKDQTFLRRMKSKHFTQLGVKANKLQTHFRVQVMY